MENNTCKICRRTNQKLFLRGEKCYSPKCPFVKRPYKPGPKPTKVRSNMSEYAKELLEKQRMRHFYGVSEKQFKNYVKNVLSKRGKVEDTAYELVKQLEKRLDNVVFRIGFAESRKKSRQLVNHGHFLVNGKSVDIPSYVVKKGDIIEVKTTKREKPVFKNAEMLLKKSQSPSWMKIDKEKMKSEISGEPSFDEAGVPAEISSIFEYYSR